MAKDITDLKFAFSAAVCGAAGTIATTLSSKIDEIKHFDVRKALDEFGLIMGFNNLVKVNDYNKHYEFGKKLGFDYISSGAGINKVFFGQGDDTSGFYINPLISANKQLVSCLKRNPGIVTMENCSAGGHNGPELSFSDTLELLKETDIFSTDNNRVIFAGGIMTPEDGVRVLDTGKIDYLQLGSYFMTTNEMNISNYYKNLILNVKKGDVGPVPSPAGLPGMGFLNKGIMPDVLSGKSLPKRPCAEVPTAGCLNCSGIRYSAEAAGYNPDSVGDYCISDALTNLHLEKDFDKKLYFVGQEIHRLKATKIESVRKRIGDFMAGIYDEIQAGTGLSEHASFVKDRFNYYKNKGIEQLSAKIFVNQGLKLENFYK